jgi:hypothetical protein
MARFFFALKIEDFRDRPRLLWLCAGTSRTSSGSEISVVEASF